jgi:hypothetical protein
MLDPKTAYIYNIILSIVAGIFIVLLINYFMNPEKIIAINSKKQYCKNNKCF